MRFRQVHLDFHTSGKIDGIGIGFNKEQFQEALKRGHVDSITLFSKCHHGYAYHPTKVHQMHPHLDFDLLGAQLEACREIGVNAPVYISAGLDEKEAVVHPEWLTRNPDESTMGNPNFTVPGYHLLCYNTGYMELLLAQIEEVMQRYNPCGIFLDISAVRPCVCASCRKSMEEQGLDPEVPEDVLKMGEQTYKNYCEKTREIIHKYNPNATIYHNGGHTIRGRRDLMHYNTHLELESLPTAGWGYDHFPMSAAYARTTGMDFLGMTGKFHTSWGEFGGYKHPNALRYEVALSIACGAKCSIGDQAHPSVKMNMATYDLIGAAYSEVEKKEKWCDNVTTVADIALLSHEAAMLYSIQKEELGDTGASRILLEGKYLYDIIDTQADLSKYKLVILPDEIRLNDELAGKLNKYIENGGKVLASGESGLKLDEDSFALDFGAEYISKSPFKPNYFVPGEKFEMPHTEYVMYGQGHYVSALDGKVVAQSEDSYFNRTTKHFCSHQHAPNKPGALHDAVVITDKTAYIGWNVFSDYAEKGALCAKRLVTNVIEMLIGKEKTLSTNLPDRGIVTLMDQTGENRLVNHLLFSYTTLRGKSTEIIEDIVPLYNVEASIRLDKEPSNVYLAPQMEKLPYEYKNGVLSYTVPKLELHQMVVIDK